MGGITCFGISIDCKLVLSPSMQDKTETGAKEMAGTVTMVYNHHARDLADKLTEQH